MATSELELSQINSVDADTASMIPGLDETSLAQKEDPDFKRLDSLGEKKRWRKATIAWLDLVCLHHSAILSLTRTSNKSKGLGTYVLNAKFDYYESYKSSKTTDYCEEISGTV